jgi:hypothetical protein
VNVALAVLVLAAAGFAGASIVSGGLAATLDVLTGTTSTTETTETVTTSTTPSRRVVLCHVTHSRKHPSHTIVVSQAAVRAHLRHGDSLGACTQTTAPAGKHGKGHDAGVKHGDDDSTSSAETSHDAGHGHGAGHGKGK